MKNKSIEQKTKEMKSKPDCYKCKYRGEVPGSAHSRCNHPKCGGINDDPMMNIISIMGGARGFMPKIPTGLKVKGNPYGIESGWFCHPLNFDPVWLEECDGFEMLDDTPKGRKK